MCKWKFAKKRHSNKGKWTPLSLCVRKSRPGKWQTEMQDCMENKATKLHGAKHNEKIEESIRPQRVADHWNEKKKIYLHTKWAKGQGEDHFPGKLGSGTKTKTTEKKRGKIRGLWWHSVICIHTAGYGQVGAQNCLGVSPTVMTSICTIPILRSAGPPVDRYTMVQVSWQRQMQIETQLKMAKMNRIRCRRLKSTEDAVITGGQLPGVEPKGRRW